MGSASGIQGASQGDECIRFGRLLDSVNTEVKENLLNLLSLRIHCLLTGTVDSLRLQVMAPCHALNDLGSSFNFVVRVM